MSKYSLFYFILPLMTFIPSCQRKLSEDTTPPPRSGWVYPKSQKQAVTDDYFGTKVNDPYRWLEDDNSVETKNWVESQNKLTFSYLDKIPYRHKLNQRITELYNYQRCGVPKMTNSGNLYFFKNNGTQNHDILYLRQKAQTQDQEILNPNQFSADGTSSLTDYAISNDEKYLAYQVSSSGSDWNEIKVMDLNNKNVLKDHLQWVKFSSTSWKGDGFYYSRFPEPQKGDALSGKNEYHGIYYHKLGTDQTEDQLVFRDNDHPFRNFYTKVTEDERFLIITASESTSGNALGVLDLSDRQNKIKWIVENFNDDYYYTVILGDELFFSTNADAANWKIVSFNVKNPTSNLQQTIIPESKDAVIDGSTFCGKYILVRTIKNASHQLQLFFTNGNLYRTIELPEMGSVGEFNGLATSHEMYFSFHSFLRPNTVFNYDMNSSKSSVFFKPNLTYNPDLYTTEQIWYKSKDGTSIPMFLTHLKNKPTGSLTPTLLYGYGGFDIPVMPAFNPARIPIIENGGLFAVANIRGGGEFGKNWHLAGTKQNKQNVFDDFIAAADFLVTHNYCTRKTLAIEGRSNGGLLIGACITQRPDLCQVAFPIVGVLDMLRYHKFTIGWAWATDYGSSESETDFNYLIKYSPLHNLKPNNYPSTMVVTADHDDRVVPAHSFKFTATLQEAQKSTRPAMIRVDVGAGHGAGKPTHKKIAESADMMSFMFDQMGITPKY